MPLAPRIPYRFPDVPATIVSRGANYYRRGKVRLETGRDGCVAKVRGTSTYTVTLSDGAEGLTRTTCTCPFAAGGHAVCKHAVATSLAASVAREVPAGSSIRLVPAISPPPDDARDTPLDDPKYEHLRAFLESRMLTTAASLPSPSRRAERAEPSAPPAPPARSGQDAKPASWRRMLAHLGERSRDAWRVVDEGALAAMDVRFVIACDAILHSGTLVVECSGRLPRSDGSAGTWKRVDLLEDEIALIRPEGMRTALGLAVAVSRSHPFYSSSGGSYGEAGRRVPHELRVPIASASSVLRGLAASNGLFALPSPSRAGSPSDPPRAEANADGLVGPLAWDDGPPWELAARLDRTPGHDDLALTASLQRGDETMSLREPILFLSSGVVVTATHVARFQHHGAMGLVVALRAGETVRVPVADRMEFACHLLARAPALGLTLPEDLALEIHACPPVHHAILRSLAGSRDVVEVTLTHEYDGIPADGADGAAPATLVDRARDRLIRRDPAAEAEALGTLRRLGVKRRRLWLRAHGSVECLGLAARQVPGAVRSLLAAGWKVEAEGKLYRSAGTPSVRVVTGIDWFDVQGEVRFDDQVATLPALLEAFSRGEGLVRLGDGSFGVLPEEWLRRFGPLAELGQARDGALRFSRAQGGILDALLAEMPEIAPDAAFARARRELATFEGVTAADAPKSFVGALRPYQREGLGWMQALRRLGLGGVLADDMGLGKTVQVLALLAGLRRPGRKRKPSLVVAPRSLVFNWQAEAARFAPKLSVLDHSGPGRAKRPDALTAHDLVLTTYGTLRRDAAMLRAIPFDVVVLDEAQAIKNAKSDTAKAVRLIQGDQRLALSGTPIENHLGELWSLFEFLNPGLLGSGAAFARIARAATTDAEGESLRLISAAVRPFVLRRTKRQVAPDLPERIEQTISCELEPKQRKLYDELREHYRMGLASRGDEFDRGELSFWVLEALLRLRQAACHPALVDPRFRSAPSAKLDALLPAIEEVASEGHAALVFSQFVEFLTLVRERLDAAGITYCYLDGSTPARERQRQVAMFQEGDKPLFLISLKAGGLGLNLTRAEYVFLLDPWWNPAVEAQAIDRAHRIGQSNTVIASRLVARDTVEERILELQARKRHVADAILSSDGSVIGKLTREELEQLLS